MTDSYETSLVVLDGGLDFQRAKLVVPAGRLIDCLNHEVIDRSGYKRIEGLDKFDGAHVGDVIYTEKSFVGTNTGSFQVPIEVGSLLALSTDLANPFGVVTVVQEVFTNPATTYTISYVAGPDAPALTGLLVEVVGDPANEQIDVDSESTLGNVPDLTVSQKNALHAIFREGITALPNRPIGLHWFRDKLYAVADESVIHFNSGGTTELYINDIIEDSANNEARVIDIDLDSGTWAGGDAAGKLLVHLIDGAGFASGDIDVIRPTTGQINNVATITSGSTVAWHAGLWKALSAAQATAEGGGAVAGWNKIDTGVIIGYEAGEFEGGVFPKIDRRTQEPNVDFGTDSTLVTGADGVFELGYGGFLYSGEAAPSAGTTNAVLVPLAGPATGFSTNSSDLVAGLTSAEDNVHPNALRSLIMQASGQDTGFVKTTPRVGMTKLNTVTTIPGYAVVRGVEVYLDNLKGASAASAGNHYNTINVEASLLKYDPVSPVKLGTDNVTVLTNINGATVNNVDVVLGSSTDLWGNKQLSLADVLSADFGVSLRAVITQVAGANSVGANVSVQASCDRVRVKIYYEKLFTRYYFRNNVTDAAGGDVQADLIDYRVFEGDPELGNAEGVMQFVDLAAVGVAPRRSIRVGDSIHLTAADTTDATKVGEVTSVTPNALASLSEILAAESRYQFITANFFGNEQWDAFYGVSGAGRAFSYDGNYFVTIYVQEEDEKDIPRHVAYHHNHLSLGFRSGVVHFSVPGDPENYSTEYNALRGEDLSFEMSVGDRITGLMPLRGTTLGVFCENSIYGIVGTTRDNFSPQTLSPSTGAIEYTVIEMGEPVYADSRGISTLAQSEKYGNFQGTRLSSDVTSWLLPRLKKNAVNGIVCSVPVRGKNQRRDFFKDGMVLTMTLVGPELQPQFTMQQYLVGAADMDDREPFLVPIAWSSQADENGVDRVHIAHYGTLSTVTSDDSEFVYELDIGWSFAGNYIPAYFVTSWSYSNNPASNYLLRKVIADGLSYGYNNVELTTAHDLSPDYQTSRVIASLPKTVVDPPETDFTPYSTVCSVGERGRTISMKFTAVGDGTVDALTHPEPAYIFQVLVLSSVQNLANIK